MNEQVTAIIILAIAYIFLSPVIFLIMIDDGSPSDFKKDYKGAFLAWHGLVITILAITAAVSSVFWAINVLI